jgi:hypothetical protein
MSDIVPLVAASMAIVLPYQLIAGVLHVLNAPKRMGMKRSHLAISTLCSFADAALLLALLVSSLLLSNHLPISYIAALFCQFLFVLLLIIHIAASFGFYNSTGSFIDLKGYTFVYINLFRLAKHEAAVSNWSLPVLTISGFVIAIAFVELLNKSPFTDAGVSSADLWWTLSYVAALPCVAVLRLFLRLAGNDELSEQIRIELSFMSGPLTRMMFGNVFLPRVRRVGSPETGDGSFHQGRPVSRSESDVQVNERGVNIIVVVVDSLRWDVVNGPDKLCLPGLQQLLDCGLSCTNHYSTASHSNYADVSILDGRFPFRSRLQYNYNRSACERYTLLYEVMKRNGYRCGLFSSQDERWGSMNRHLRSETLDAFLHAGNASQFERTSTDSAALIRRSHSGKIDDGDVVAAAIEWARSADRPYILFLNLQRSHFPYSLPFFDETISANSRHNGSNGTFGKIDPKILPRVRERYNRAISSIDELISQMFVDLDIVPGKSNHVLAITGDTGQAFGEHGLFAHGCELYQEVIKVPLIIAFPDCHKASRSLVSSHVDIFPTIAGLVNARCYNDLDGRDLLKQDAPQRSKVYAICQTAITSQLAAIEETKKTIYDFCTRCQYEFDLEADPAETSPKISAMAPRLASEFLLEV